MTAPFLVDGPMFSQEQSETAVMMERMERMMCFIGFKRLASSQNRHDLFTKKSKNLCYSRV